MNMIPIILGTLIGLFIFTLIISILFYIIYTASIKPMISLASNNITKEINDKELAMISKLDSRIDSRINNIKNDLDEVKGDIITTLESKIDNIAGILQSR